jgi:hypothetical protein
MLSTPVVLVIFNRPSLTQQVFQRIRAVQPVNLFVLADGPRSEAEAMLCHQTRAVVKQVDWDCDVIQNYSDSNLGCRNRISSGLSWVFDQVEEAIILEDDCLPRPSFFYFCQALLKYYRNDSRIMHIAGSNFVSDHISILDSYYFSQYFSIWGWATWKRAWSYYDMSLKDWPNQRRNEILENLYENPLERQDMEKILTDIYQNKIDTWDYQWNFSCRLQNGLAIIPSKNMVSNIGFGEGASRTKSKLDPRANLPTSDLWDIQHPAYIFRNKIIDNFRYKRHFKSGKNSCFLQKFWGSIKFIASQILRDRAVEQERKL